MKVGIILSLRDSSSGPAPRYGEIRALVRQAEASGIDSFWLFDHLLVRAPGQPDYGFWEAWTMLSALAEATSRIEAGTLVACASFRNPAVLAKMAEALDEVSLGRVVLGLGAGWLQSDFEPFGLPHDHLVGRLEEALEIICPFLRTGTAEFAGRFWRATACVNLPRGPRPSGLPVLVGGHGPRLLRLAARFADAWNTCWFARPDDEWQRQRGALEQACREEGRDPASLALTVGVPVVHADLGATLPVGDERGRVVAGDAAEVVSALRAFDAVGVAHVMCSLKPTTPVAVERLAKALQVYRAG